MAHLGGPCFCGGNKDAFCHIGRRKSAKITAKGLKKQEAKVGKKASKTANAAAKANDKPKAERTNKKAEVIGMMKRAKGATLAEIMDTTGWQKHTVRGFVSILGKNGGEKVESSQNASGGAHVQNRERG